MCFAKHLGGSPVEINNRVPASQARFPQFRGNERFCVKNSKKRSYHGVLKAGIIKPCITLTARDGASQVHYPGQWRIQGGAVWGNCPPKPLWRPLDWRPFATNAPIFGAHGSRNIS